MIIPVKYLHIPIDARTFNRIIRFVVQNVGGTSDLTITVDFFYSLCKPGDNTVYEFVRLKHEDFYIDLRLDKFTVNRDNIILSFGKVIDYNRTRYISKTKFASK